MSLQSKRLKLPTRKDNTRLLMATLFGMKKKKIHQQKKSAVEGIVTQQLHITQPSSFTEPAAQHVWVMIHSIFTHIHLYILKWLTWNDKKYEIITMTTWQVENSEADGIDGKKGQGQKPTPLQCFKLKMRSRAQTGFHRITVLSTGDGHRANSLLQNV